MAQVNLEIVLHYFQMVYTSSHCQHGQTPKVWEPKGSRGRSEIPLVASAEAKFLRNAANPYRKSIKAPPHNSAARLAMSFPPSAACKFLDLPPVNLRNLHLHLTKNPFASRPPHLCGVTLGQSRTKKEQPKCRERGIIKR